MADEQRDFEVPLVWEDIEERPITFATQFLIQHQPDEFVLSVGQLVTPPIIGTEEQRMEQLRKLSYVPVRVLGRYGFTRRRLVELISILQQNLERHDDLVRKMEEEA